MEPSEELKDLQDEIRRNKELLEDYEDCAHLQMNLLLLQEKEQKLLSKL